MGIALKPRARKAVLSLHIVSAGAWIGIDVIVACLVVVGQAGDDREVRGLSYQALARGVPAVGDVSALVFPPAVSLTALTIAVLLSVYKPWGRVRDGGAVTRSTSATAPGSPSRRSAPAPTSAG